MPFPRLGMGRRAGLERQHPSPTKQPSFFPPHRTTKPRKSSRRRRPRGNPGTEPPSPPVSRELFGARARTPPPHSPHLRADVGDEGGLGRLSPRAHPGAQHGLPPRSPPGGPAAAAAPAGAGGQGRRQRRWRCRQLLPGGLHILRLRQCRPVPSQVVDPSHRRDGPLPALPRASRRPLPDPPHFWRKGPGGSDAIGPARLQSRRRTAQAARQRRVGWRGGGLRSDPGGLGRARKGTNHSLKNKLRLIVALSNQ